jgi:hypothetical protein
LCDGVLNKKFALKICWFQNLQLENGLYNVKEELVAYAWKTA